jgi:hypothetical protein
MTESLLTILTFFTEQPWMIPVIGALSASLAFLFGRRGRPGRSCRRTAPRW